MAGLKKWLFPLIYSFTSFTMAKWCLIISSSTKKVDTRARARAISLKVANTAASQDWKLGTFRLDIQADGRR